MITPDIIESVETDWSPSDEDWNWYLETTYCDPNEKDYL